MKIEGQLIKCDYPNCEEHIMRAKIGEGETDGGYTKYAKYEPKPEGWGYVDSKDLCPDHYQYYLDMIAEFWEPPVQEEPKHASGVTLHLTNGTVLDALGLASSTYTLSFSIAYCIFIRPHTCISSAIFLVYSLIVSNCSLGMFFDGNIQAESPE